MSGFPKAHTDPKCTSVDSNMLKVQKIFGWQKEQAAHIFLFSGENKLIFEELCFLVFKSSPIFALKLSSP